MERLIIIPKDEEWNQLFGNISDETLLKGKTIVLNPNSLIMYDYNDVNEIQTADKITYKIKMEFNKPSTDKLYILYHIGNLLDITALLKERLPSAEIIMYSSTDNKTKYETLQQLIPDIHSKDPFERIIKLYFRDELLELTLDLLHNCLDETFLIKKNNKFINEINEIIELSKEKDIVKKAFETYSNRNGDHYSRLIEMRDILFSI